jgi:uncharacterized membrane protein
VYGPFYRSARIVRVLFPRKRLASNSTQLADISAPCLGRYVPFNCLRPLGTTSPGPLAMVPPAFPRPEFPRALTGLFDIAGAVGLMRPRTAPYAALGLCFLLLAVFPANVHAARQQLSIAGRRVETLLPRALLQFVFLAATAIVFVAARR